MNESPCFECNNGTSYICEACMNRKLCTLTSERDHLKRENIEYRQTIASSEAYIDAVELENIQAEERGAREMAEFAAIYITQVNHAKIEDVQNMLMRDWKRRRAVMTLSESRQKKGGV